MHSYVETKLLLEIFLTSPKTYRASKLVQEPNLKSESRRLQVRVRTIPFLYYSHTQAIV